SKVPVNLPRLLLKPRLNMLLNEPRNMGYAKLTSSSRDQVPDVKQRSVHCRLLAWKSGPSRTSPRLHITVHARQRVVASKAFEHPLQQGDNSHVVLWL